MADELLILVRTVQFASTVMTAGVPTFQFFVSDPAIRRMRAAIPRSIDTFCTGLTLIAWMTLAASILSGAAWLVLVAADINDRSLIETLSGDAVSKVLRDSRFGNVWLARLGMAILLAALLVTSRHKEARQLPPQHAISVLLAACMLGSLAWVGHSGTSAGTEGNVHLGVDVIHLCAAGAWLGGLLPLALLFHFARTTADETWIGVARDAARRFSILGLASVGTLIATGLANAWFLAGNVPSLVGTPYGRLLVLKIALFAAMVAVAAINRLRLTPRLFDMSPTTSDRSSRTLRQLQRNTLVELVLGLFVLLIVGALGTISPAVHVQPWWPLPFRFATEMFDHPTYGPKIIVMLSVSLVGIILICGGLLLRRLRWPLIALGVLGMGFLPQSVGLLTVEAFPTTFYASPTGYSVRSIARGKDLFSVYCAVCHQRKGDAEIPVGGETRPTSDLTSDHIFDHRDGDLFWWIANGKNGMPGFADLIDEEERWNLIDFVRSNADAAHVKRYGADDPLLSVPVPDFSCEVPDGSTISIAQLRGRIIYLMFAQPRSADRVRQMATLELGSDVAKIMVALGSAMTEDVSVCVVRDAAAENVFAMYRDGDVAHLDGTELIVDAAGLLRAIVQVRSDPSWDNPDTLKRLIDDIRRRAALPRSRIPHAHHH
jgi:putative copper resistance protein D